MVLHCNAVCIVYELYFPYTNRKRSIRLRWDRISSTIVVICAPYIDMRPYSVATSFSYRQVAVLLLACCRRFLFVLHFYLIFVPFLFAWLFAESNIKSYYLLILSIFDYVCAHTLCIVLILCVENCARTSSKVH